MRLVFMCLVFMCFVVIHTVLQIRKVFVKVFAVHFPRLV